MKKLISLVLVISLCLCVPFGAYAVDAEQSVITVLQDVADAKETEQAVIAVSQDVVDAANDSYELMSALGVNNDVSVSAETVARKDFVLAVIDLLNFQTSDKKQESPFSDVLDGTDYACALSYALSIGMISQAESFYPDRAVTYDEAIKMAVCAMGYGDEAVYSGGYPYGYYKYARSLELNSSVSAYGAQPLSGYDFYALLKNMSEADVQVVYGVEISEDSITFNERNENLLSAYHNIYELTGLVEGNEVSYLYDASLTTPQGFIQVDGVLYKADMFEYPLGCRIEGYVRKKSSSYMEIVWAHTNENKIVNMGYDAVFSSDYRQLHYIDENGNSKNYRLSDTYAIIYNGKSYMSDTLPSLDECSVQIIDNNHDNVYDVINIKKSSFIKVKANNSRYNMIYGEYENIPLDIGNETVVRCKGLNGIIDVADIISGQWFEYYISEDNQLVTMIELDEGISGVFTEMDSSNEAIYIDDVKYYYTDYFETTSLHKINFGDKINFVLSTDGKLVYASVQEADEYPYGYLYDIGKSNGLDSEVMVKIFTQNGLHEIYTLSDKVILEETSKKKSEVYDYLKSQGEILIRYHINDSGLLDKIVTENGSVESDDKKLERYKYSGYDSTTEQLQYRTTGIFYPYFVIDNSTINFMICTDTDITPEERFNIGKGLYIIGNGKKLYRCNAMAYNVDDYGYTSVTVCKMTKAEQAAIGEASAWGIVSDVTHAIAPDGQTSIKLELYQSNSYSTYYVKKDADFLSDIRPETTTHFKKGDVIRFAVNHVNYITSAVLDFDGDKKQLIFTSDDEYDDLFYRYDKLYSVGPQSVSVFENDDTSIIRSLIWRTKTVDKVTKDGFVECVPISDLISYIDDNGQCSNVLLKIDSGKLIAIIMYE